MKILVFKRLKRMTLTSLHFSLGCRKMSLTQEKATSILGVAYVPCVASSQARTDPHLQVQRGELLPCFGQWMLVSSYNEVLQLLSKKSVDKNIYIYLEKKIK